MADEQITLEVHPTSPRARVRVLTGTDDGHAYRVQVPLRCKSVADALAWLRPVDVPEGALRQGEFFFAPASRPTIDYGYTPAGSEYEVTVHTGSFSARHLAAECLVSQKFGRCAFVGRRRVRTHAYTARPKYFVRGIVQHPEHGDLDLPEHAAGPWYRVIPNRAHGPFPVVGLGQED